MKTRLFGLITIVALLTIAKPAYLKAQVPKVDRSKIDTFKGTYKFKGGDDLDREYVDRILTKKTKLLQGYLTTLVTRKDPHYLRTVQKAMLLFNNDESRLVTVTNKTTGKVYVKPIRMYLEDVAKLPYKSVSISYRNYSAINNIRRQPDGMYKGVVVFEQEFTGFDKEGKVQYHDVVSRNVEVTIRESIYPKSETVHVIGMDIFFGNVGVTEYTNPVATSMR